MNHPAKNLTLFALFLCLATVSMAQLKPKTAACPDLTVDILNGTINGQKSNTGGAEFKTVVPCSTGTEEDGPSAKCGGVIYYKDKDVSFYTQRKYFQIGPKFKGKMSLHVLGTPRNSLFKYLGNPKIKDALWDAYETQYGTLVLHFDVAGAAGKVKFFQFSTLTTDELNLCE